MSKVKKRIINLFFIIVVVSFFVTPLGYESKVLLNRLFAVDPLVIAPEDSKVIDYDWKLKDAQWNFFNFEKSKGKPVFVCFWASWRVPAVAELQGIQKLYNDYKKKIDFYVITNEEREPVEKLMKRRGYTFPVTYLVIGEKMPFDAEEVPSGYVIDRSGHVVMEYRGVANWNSNSVRDMLNMIVSE